MDSKQEKNLESNLLNLLERSSKFSDERIARLSKKSEAQGFASRLAQANPTIFASTLDEIVLSDLLVFVPMLEKILQGTKFQHGVRLAKAQQEAADAKLAKEFVANDQEGERAAKRQRIGNKPRVSHKHSSVNPTDNTSANETRAPGGRSSPGAVDDATTNETRVPRGRSSPGAVDDATTNEDRCGGEETTGRTSRSSSVSSAVSRASSRSRSPDEEAHVGRQLSVPVEAGELSRMAALRSNGPGETNLSSLFLNDEEFELAITTASPPALARVKKTWNGLGNPRDFRRGSLQCEREQDMVLSYVIKLDFFKSGPDVVRHLRHQELIRSQSGHQPSVTELARLATSQETAPFQRFKALESMTGRGRHVWILRVYGEILLWETVQAEVERRSDAILVTRPKSKKSEHQTILKNMAREAAEKEGYTRQKDIDRVIAQFEKHFYAGRKWRTVANDFNGSGIIIVFIVAGLCASLIGSTLTEYQRRRLGDLSGSLPKIGRLVQAMGENALQVYCEMGCLPLDRFVKVKELVKEQTGFEVNDDL